MRRYGNQILLSASDLTTFLGCRQATCLALQDLEQPLPRSAVDPQMELLADKGFEHERSYLINLKARGLSVIEINPEENLDSRWAKTLTAMKQGPDVIYQAALLKPPWHGLVDFLRRVPADSDLGPYSYQVWDTKLARTPNPKHLMQLCVYSDLLSQIQGRRPTTMHLVMGDNRELGFSFDQFFYYYIRVKGQFERFVANSELTYPLPCQQCDACPWKDMCAQKWEDDDHLSLVANIRRTQIDRLTKAGVRTVRSLATLPPDRRVPGLAVEVLDRLRSQASLQVSKRESGQSRYLLLPIEEGRGFQRLPRPDPGDIFLDLEGDPLYPDGLEYLFGMVFAEKGRPDYRCFWAHDHDQERAAVEQVMDLFEKHLARWPQAHIYHYNHYEKTAIKRLTSRYGTRENFLDHLLREQKLVDLYQVVREAVRVSEPGYSLKNLETFYLPRRQEEITSAGDSLVRYENWRQTAASEHLTAIRDYNQADCLSLQGLRTWLLEIRPPRATWFETLKKSANSSSKTPNICEARRQEYEHRLQAAKDENFPQGELVSYLLEFHHREARPKWWAVFDRREKSAEELLDDPECLAGLQPAPKNLSSPQVREFAYHFPPQEHKFKSGDKCRKTDNLWESETIVHIDPSRRIAIVRHPSNSGPYTGTFALIPAGPLNDNVLREALCRFADSIIAAGAQYPALKMLLNRATPKIRGLRPGADLIPTGEDTLKAAIRVAAGLDGGYLFIQGPPGTGKTYIAARIIVALIAAGKKIGVASNSHKAINNLLTAVEERARKEGIRFRGIKKSNASQKDSFFDGRMIENVTDNKTVSLSADLIAGTAWLFARPELDRVLDYLFIDEAGQVSLANVVAMGLSARNIVLVGDQMQLAQPIQGVHPGESGLSVLDYLLQDLATVPPWQGIFLPISWRMHPGICRFISEAVYDGRLSAAPQNQKQHLILKTPAHPALKESGVGFVEVEHSGCSQMSIEEAEIIRAIHANLLTQRFTDHKGKVYPVTVNDILVVSPYNMQVNHLKSVLPAESRVGTVDKFQGQEAAVVLISMATSSSEDLSRHLDFLFSRNRLNVAISRARCLSLIVASPRLMEISCRTLDQMKLVNTLCWAHAYSLADRL